MGKKINLYWYNLRVNYGNFGDELSHFLIEKLSGCEVNQIYIPLKGLDYIKRSLSFIYHKNIRIKEYPKLVKQFFIREYVVAIGSIMSRINNKNAKIWGSGIMRRNDNINKAHFFAVRGKYTQIRLTELGFVPPKTIGDPALLLPLVYSPKYHKSYKLGIITHFVHFNYIKENILDSEILIIDLTNKIEIVIDEINSCEFTISTSLHGIIVSHVFNIPCLWFYIDGMPLSGDNIKFYDYFSSVNIREYSPFKINIGSFNVYDIINLIDNNKDIIKINCNLLLIQKELLKSAPFKILEEYLLLSKIC